MRLYTLTPQKVGAVFGVGKKNLRLLVFQHFAIVWEKDNMKHTKTDPVCIYFKETWPFLRYLNERARGKACLICVPLWRSTK